MAGKEIAVKKYVVRLNAWEREQPEGIVHAGKNRAQSLTRARVLLKADGQSAVFFACSGLVFCWLIIAANMKQPPSRKAS